MDKMFDLEIDFSEKLDISWHFTEHHRIAKAIRENTHDYYANASKEEIEIYLDVIEYFNKKTHWNNQEKRYLAMLV